MKDPTAAENYCMKLLLLGRHIYEWLTESKGSTVINRVGRYSGYNQK